jgi:hypothetical protein
MFKFIIGAKQLFLHFREWIQFRVGRSAEKNLDCFNDNECLNSYNTAFLTFQGVDSIPCREIGYILRSLGQNPTENEIIALVCEAGCDWEGYLTRFSFDKNNFLSSLRI